MLYFLILISLLFIQGNTIKSKKVFLTIAFFELLFVSGFREIDADGSDTRAYCETFLMLSRLSFREVFDSYDHEVGYYLFCRLLSCVSKDPHILVFVSSAIMNFLVVRFIYKKSNDPAFSIFLYITLMFFFSNLNLMRFCMASSILLLATDSVVDRKPVKFFLILFIASLFHYSTLIYGLIYLIYSIKLNKKTMLFLSISFVIVSYIFQSLFMILILLNARYASYDHGYGEFYQSAFANILKFVVNSIFFFFCWRNQGIQLERLTNESKFYFWSLFLAVLFSALSIQVMMIIRFAYLFAIMQIIYIPNVISQIPNRHKAFFCKNAVRLVTLIQMIVILSFRQEWYFINPYKLIF